MKKNRSNTQNALVYSTDPNFSLEPEDSAEPVTLAPSSQKLRIRLETKHRAGKTVTLIDGFIGTQSDREVLVKKLKNHCGTGGAAKEGEMLIQGDHRDKILQWLIKNGYTQSKKI